MLRIRNVNDDNEVKTVYKYLHCAILNSILFFSFGITQVKDKDIVQKSAFLGIQLSYNLCKYMPNFNQKYFQ